MSDRMAYYHSTVSQGRTQFTSTFSVVPFLCQVWMTLYSRDLKTSNGRICIIGEVLLELLPRHIAFVSHQGDWSVT